MGHPIGFRLYPVFILAFLYLLSAAYGDSLADSAPVLSLVNKPRTTSVEIQAQRVLGNAYEPCFGHAVQYKLFNEETWLFTPILEKGGGRFVLSGLKPGQTYSLRVACKDNKVPASTGEFSAPIKIQTPLANQKEDTTTPKPTEAAEQAKTETTDSPNGAITITSAGIYTIFAIFAIFGRILV